LAGKSVALTSAWIWNSIGSRSETAAFFAFCGTPPQAVGLPFSWISNSKRAVFTDQFCGWENSAASFTDC
jgi:hypothetical protein